MWLHASPLLLRLGLASAGILFWFLIQSTAEDNWSFWLAVATISLASLIITINPLMKSNGYHLLSAYLDETHLKGKSYKALINKIKGTTYKEANQNTLAAYALTSFLFILFIIALVLYVTGHILKIKLGGAGILATMIIAFFILKRLVVKLKLISEAYDRSTRFDRWKKRTLPNERVENVQEKPKFTFLSFIKVASIVLFLALLFTPYHFSPGGNFIILPHQKQELAADISGIIDNVYFDGGEILNKGTRIAQLNCSEYSSQEKIFSARIQEQKAIIDELKSKPRHEEVLLARSALEVQKTRVQFSEAKVSRLEKLYKDRATSFEELDDARREYRVDIDQREEKEANLKLVELGASPDEIAAAEAKLKSLEEQRNYYQNIIERSTLYMPFQGRLVDLHLQQKVGSFLEKGKPFTIVENTEKVIAQIEVAEPDIGYIEKMAKTLVRPMAMQNEEFQGVVSIIAPNVEKRGFGKVVQVTTVLDNKNEMLKSGMTGYAKIECNAMPAWKVFSSAILRFIRVEMWSWIP
jgi:putative peptide zinc metalloprotease protein